LSLVLRRSTSGIVDVNRNRSGGRRWTALRARASRLRWRTLPDPGSARRDTDLHRRRGCGAGEPPAGAGPSKRPHRDGQRRTCQRKRAPPSRCTASPPNADLNRAQILCCRTTTLTVRGHDVADQSSGQGTTGALLTHPTAW